MSFVSKVTITTLNICKIVSRIEALLIHDGIDSRKKIPSTFISSTDCPIGDYILRLLNFFNIEISTLVIALIYLERIRSCFALNSKNFHKCFLMALSMATKMNEDKIFKNSYYCVAGGVHLKEYNILEKNFLEMLDYSLFVTNSEYLKYINF